MIQRSVFEHIMNGIKPGKAVIIIGTRRTGKTVLMRNLISHINEPCLLLNGEDFSVQEMLSKRSAEHYRNVLGNYRFVAIDEAHHIDGIGWIIKLMLDEIKDLKVILTGSSSFDVQNKSGEPLTGRKNTFLLFPFSEAEMNQVDNPVYKSDALAEKLIYGTYPELVFMKDHSEKTDYLKELLHSYLLKDILVYEGVRNSSVIYNLLKLIAFQSGNEVSCAELAGNLGISKNTVEKYLDLLSKVFIVFKIPGFSRNLRKEITKSTKWFFFDNGVRNIIIGNLNPITDRQDIGMLWENYVLSERVKYQHYSGMIVQNYFWRTYDQQEIDWVEEREGKLFAYEVKWKEQNCKIPTAWKNSYPDSAFQTIHPENYRKWIGAGE